MPQIKLKIPIKTFSHMKVEKLEGTLKEGPSPILWSYMFLQGINIPRTLSSRNAKSKSPALGLYVQERPKISNANSKRIKAAYDTYAPKP